MAEQVQATLNAMVEPLANLQHHEDLWTAAAQHEMVHNTAVGRAAAHAILESNPYRLSDPDHIVIDVQQLSLKIRQQDKKKTMPHVSFIDRRCQTAPPFERP